MPLIKLRSISLGKNSFGKLPLEKLSFGKSLLGKYLYEKCIIVPSSGIMINTSSPFI